jgi:energy-coupling factor transporter transmembrane protein EcfT
MGFVASKSMKTADDVYDAMLSRGFTGAMPSLVRLRTTARDWVWIAASVTTCALTLGLDRLLAPR